MSSFCACLLSAVLLTILQGPLPAQQLSNARPADAEALAALQASLCNTGDRRTTSMHGQGKLH